MSSSIFHVLVQLLQCERRAPSSAATAEGVTDSKIKLEISEAKARNDGGRTDCSTTDISDECSQGQTDSSSEAMEVLTSPQSSFRAPPGLPPPPGLDLSNVQQTEGPVDTGFKSWNCVISQQIQQTCSGQQAGMEGGRGRYATTNFRPKQPNPPAKDPLIALKEALDKLAPGEIATVRNLLDSKVRDGEGGSSSNPPPWTTSKRQDGSERPPRGFAPFGATTKPAKNRSSPSKPILKEEPTDSLRSFLHELTLIGDDARVLSVRKINHLGFHSAPALQTYFSSFGTVQRVMVTPTVVKCKPGLSGNEKKRARPAGLGFVVMSTAAEAQAVLSRGETHIVNGVEISAFSFQSHSVDTN